MDHKAQRNSQVSHNLSQLNCTTEVMFASPCSSKLPQSLSITVSQKHNSNKSKTVIHFLPTIDLRGVMRMLQSQPSQKPVLKVSKRSNALRTAAKLSVLLLNFYDCVSFKCLQGTHRCQIKNAHNERIQFCILCPPEGQDSLVDKEKAHCYVLIVSDKVTVIVLCAQNRNTS